jgi:hypothetical protein
VELDFLRRHFPSLPSYDRFIALKHCLLVPRLMFFANRSRKETRSYYMDSIALPVCYNRHITPHKVFEGWRRAARPALG